MLGWTAAVVAALLLALAMFPWGPLAGTRLRLLGPALGRPVTVERARRVDWIGFTPTVELRGVTIGQPAWAGPGVTARIASVRVRVPVLPLLSGHFRPRDIELRGLRLFLFRDAAGRDTWSGTRGGGGPGPGLERVAITDGRFRLLDLRRHVVLAGTVGGDGTGALRIAGRGTLRDRPLTVEAASGAAAPGRRWPLQVRARSPLVDLDARLACDRPFDLRAFSARVEGRGEDLRYFDDLVQAGLFPTRRFRAAAALRRDGGSWRVSGLTGDLPHTRVADAALLVRADPGARTTLTGTVTAPRFSFDDFADGGPGTPAGDGRVFPTTRLDLAGLARLDGTVQLRAARLLDAEPFRSLTVRAALDRRRLRLDPIAATLRSGRLDGWMRVDAGGPKPALRLDARVTGATFEGLVAPGGAIRGPLSARVRLEGAGPRFNAALGASRGTIGLAMTAGSVRHDAAVVASGNVLRSAAALLGGGDGRVPLRCFAGRFVVAGGVGRPSPLVVDTREFRADGRGTLDLGAERLDLLFAPRPKHAALLRASPALRLTGPFSAPRAVPVTAGGGQKTGPLGAVLRTLHLRGDGATDRPAPDANCAALARAALR